VAQFQPEADRPLDETRVVRLNQGGIVISRYNTILSLLNNKMEVKKSSKQTSTVRLNPNELAELSQNARYVNLSGIELSPQALRDVDLISRSQTASVRPEDANSELRTALEDARARLEQLGIGVNLVTIYNLPPDIVDDLAGDLTKKGIPYKRGPKGLEVYGPLKDRSVDIESMVASGRISPKEKNRPSITEQIKEKIIIEKF